MNKQLPKELIAILALIFSISCSQSPQNISPTAYSSAIQKYNIKIITPSPISSLVPSPVSSLASPEPEISIDTDKGEHIVCEPMKTALANLSVKCPRNIAVSKDGKSIYFTNYFDDFNSDSDPIECHQPPKDRISFINKIANHKLDIVRLEDNTPFYRCGSSIGELQIDKENSLYYNEGNIKKITNQGKVINVTNDIFRSYHDCKLDNQLNCFQDWGYSRINITDDGVYYISTTDLPYLEKSSYFIKKQDNNSNKVTIAEVDGSSGYYNTKYAIYNNEVYVLKNLFYNIREKDGFKMVKLPNNYPLKFESDYPLFHDLIIISNLEEVIKRSINNFRYYLNDFVSCMKINSKGEIFFNDLELNVIWKIIPKQGEEAPAVIFVGNSTKLGLKDGKGQEAEFNHPYSFDFDSQDNMYIADTGNNAIRKVTPDGLVTTIFKEKIAVTN